MILASIPSPTTAVWEVGPFPLRAYALFIMLGIVIATVVTEARLRGRGAPRGTVLDLAVWAVPFGIVGARIYHVVTSPDQYFGAGGDPVRVLYVWEGGLGIWGAIAGGAVGVWLACRQMKLPFAMVADAAAVGIPLAQAVGRLGNWFNNELYGAATTLPWGLEVHRMVDGRAVPDPVTGETALPGLYHPTFLYELLWNVGVAVLVWQLGKRLRLGHGRQFALYVMAYTAGRFWIEMLRIDDTAEMPVPGATDTVTTLLGQRINVWVAAVVFLLALGYFLRASRAPQEFLLPASAADGSAGDAGTDLRVVTEEEYRRAVAAGGERTGAGDADDRRGVPDGASVDDGSPADDGSSAGDGPTGDGPPAGADEAPTGDGGAGTPRGNG